MKTYSIPFNEDDKDRYLDLEDLMGQIRNILSTKIGEKPELIKKFDVCLQNDIHKIYLEVEDINQEVVKEWLLDAKSDPAQIRETLIDLSERLNTCQKKSLEYRKYQKEYRLDATSSDAHRRLLDKVINEVKLRQTLWDSVQQVKNT